MLQVARLAPKQLGESRDLVAAFLRERVNPDGGFQDRAGASDLYYTVFGLDALIALQEDVPAAPTAAYLDGFGDGAGLDFVHLACLARGWAALRRPPDHGPRRSHRSPASKRAAAPTAATRRCRRRRTAAPTARSWRWARIRISDAQSRRPSGVVTSLGRLRAADGSYGNHPGLPSGVTTATAAAVLVLRHLDAPLDRAAGLWLLDRCHARGGFFASPSTPVPDLLSTATALHALVGAASADRRPPRSVPRFRRLALDQPRRLLRHLGRRRGRLRIHLLRAARAGPSQPRSVVMASDRDRRRCGARVPSSAGCSTGARLPTTGTAAWRAARSRRRPPCSPSTPRRGTAIARDRCVSTTWSGPAPPGCFSIRTPTAAGATPSAVEATSARRRSCGRRCRRSRGHDARAAPAIDAIARVAAARGGRHHADGAPVRHPPPLRQGPHVLGADPDRAGADRQARRRPARGLAIDSTAAVRAGRGAARLVSASSAAGRELRAAGADRDRPGAASLRAVAQSGRPRAAERAAFGA